MSDFLEQLQAAKTDKERDWLVMKFSLDALDPEVREAVWAAAIPRWFDRAFLAEVLNRGIDENFERNFEKLLSLPFVEVFQGRGYNVHERSRNLLLNRLWADDASHYRELNKRAANYCGRQVQSDILWRVALLYHLLLSDENRGVVEFIDQGIGWMNKFEFSKLESLARSVIGESNQDHLNKRALAWAYYFQGASDQMFSRFTSAEKNLMLALNSYGDDMHLKSVSLEMLGDVYTIMGENQKARDSLNEALKLARQLEDKTTEANCIYSLAELHRLQGEFDEAQKKYTEVITRYRDDGDKVGEANSRLSLGEIYVGLSKLKEAAQEHDAALQLYREIGNQIGEAFCIKSIGDMFTEGGDYEKAQQKYLEALTLFEQNHNEFGKANSLARLAELYELKGEYREAKASLEEALEIYIRVGGKRIASKYLTRLEDIRKRLEPRERKD
jgi:tetratricopeptide (TPR) repeat protein